MVERVLTRTPLSIGGLKATATRVDPAMPDRERDLFVAHALIETGLAHCYNYNAGNVRPLEGEDWTLYGCGEELEIALAAKLKAESPDLVTFKGGQYNRGGKRLQSVAFKPPHPFCKFRSFDNPGASVLLFLKFLRRITYRGQALATGDPAQYNAALVRSRYYTADPDTYLKGLRNSLAVVQRNTEKAELKIVPIPAVVQVAPVVITPAAEEWLTEPEREHIEQMIALTAAGMVAEMDLS